MTSPLHALFGAGRRRSPPLSSIPRCRREQRPVRKSTASSCWQYLRSHKQDIELADGSLVILGPLTNRLRKHTTVKIAKVVLPRLSLAYSATSSRYSPVTRQVTLGLPYPPQVLSAEAVTTAPINEEGAALSTRLAEEADDRRRQSATRMFRMKRRKIEA